MKCKFCMETEFELPIAFNPFSLLRKEFKGSVNFDCEDYDISIIVNEIRLDAGKCLVEVVDINKSITNISKDDFYNLKIIVPENGVRCLEIEPIDWSSSKVLSMSFTISAIEKQ